MVKPVKQFELNKRIIEIGDTTVRPGERKRISLPVAMIYTHTAIEMPIHVINGRRAGPCLFVCAAVHGDELNGIEIIRRLLQLRAISALRGTLIVVPIVNVFGVLNHSRYLPDRRDLNRCFPGNEGGSMASRLAHLFYTEIVSQCDYGIDLHTGALHRSNLPQVRADLENPETLKLAKAFGVPVMVNIKAGKGTLRACANKKDINMLVYEAGEALCFDEVSIRGGVSGIVNVMREVGMLKRISRKRKKPRKLPLMATKRGWVRSPQGGIFRTHVALGDRVKQKTLLGVIAAPFGDQEQEIRSENDGIVIGRSTLPLVNEGDALFHIASFSRPAEAAARVDAFHSAEGLVADAMVASKKEPKVK